MKRALVFGIITVVLVSFFPGCLIPRENVPPVPYLTASATFFNVDEKVIFSANGSADKDGEIIRYSWNFGDGTNKTGKFVDHNYTSGGNYTVILIITDNDGKKALQTLTVHVNERPSPLIEITPPAYIHEPVYFYANNSNDTDGFITNYVWDFGDGTNQAGMSVSHIYTKKDWFNVTLTVTDNDGAKAATIKRFPIIYRTYKVEWIDTEILSEEVGGGYLEEENSTLFSMNINILNLTRVMFNLTWQDTQPYLGDPPLLEPEPNDEFILNITSPDEEYLEKGPSSSEKITIYAPKTGLMNPKPPEFTQQAESEVILRGYLAENYTTNGGIGDWAINITLINAGGATGLEPNFDYGEDWVFNYEYRYYYPVITKL